MVRKKLTEQDLLKSMEQGIPRKPRPQIRFGSEHRTQRVKWTLYFVMLGLVVLAGTCHLLVRHDWSAVGRREAAKHFLAAEAAIAKEPLPHAQKVYKLMARCNVMLRDRWMMGYFHGLGTSQGGFIGKIPTIEFRKAIGAQLRLIDAGQPFDEKKIPKHRLTIEFPVLRCRLVAAERPQREP